MPLLILLLAIALVVAFVMMVSRGNELFMLSVRDGKVLLIRGRLPVALQHDIEDVLHRARVQHATIRAVRSSGHARLVMDGIDDASQQRLRNTFGVHPVQTLSSAPIATNRNLGQLLGWTWLAWMLRR